MKKLLYAWGLIFSTLILAFAFALPAVAASDKNDFVIKSFDSKYELGRDSEGRSTLRVTETITAIFSDLNKNHGLERAIPNRYDDHTVSLNIESVKDTSGSTLQSSETASGDTTLLRIGDPNKYVHGENTYVVTYTQKDVTKNYSDTGKDEWYWDVLGTQWRVPIQSATVSVSLSQPIRGALRGEPYCYAGTAGSSNSCELIDEGGGKYSLALQNLKPGEGATLAFGFNSGVFEQYKASPIFMILALLNSLAYFVSFPAIVIMVIIYSRRRNRAGETSTFATEFIPPKGVSVTASSQVVETRGSVFAAQLIDLAVRHYISIVETRPKSTFKQARYDIVIKKDPSTLLAEEQEIISDIFGHLPNVGERIAMHELKNNISYARRLSDNTTKLTRLVQGEYGLREKSKDASRIFRNIAIVFVFVSLLSFNPMAIGVVIIGWVLGATLRPLTNKGVELRRYLKGLERYVKSTEKDRLAFLQGPETAEKVGYAVDTKNPGQMVKLYERTLPYAILFGQEKEWGRRMGEFYQQTSEAPTWYAGQTAFNAAMFAGTLSSISSSAAASSYSGSSSSSGSGGSSGGGFSGGGGGGGGGGGW